MATPPDPLSWFEAALEGIEPFLLSDDIFRPLRGLPGPPQQDQSLGAILLVADSLEAGDHPDPPAERARAVPLLHRWEEERSNHPAAIERKALAELSQRHNLWRAYLADLLEDAREARSFATDVRNRVLLTRLQTELLEPEGRKAWSDRCEVLDRRLRPIWSPGPFLWAPYLATAYSQEDYWFLYGSPTGARA